MKKIVIAVSLVAMSLMASDYSQMSTEELTNLRGNVPVGDREAFRAEMQSRMQAMTPQERAQYRANRGMKNTQGFRDGSGVGGMNHGSTRIKKQQNQGMRQKLKDGSSAGK